MKIIHISGIIQQTISDKDWFMFRYFPNVPYDIFEIDEIDPDNKEICIDLVRSQDKTDINRQGKYYIENGELYQRDGWVEHIEEMI